MRANGNGPWLDNKTLLTKIVSVINTHERCLSQEELMAEAGVSHKVLNTRGWSMDFLYRSAGRIYERPHLNSRFEDRVYSVLSEIVPDMEMKWNKPLPGMSGFKGGDLRVDFFVEDLNLIVEADGDQHLHGRGDLDNLEYIRANDRLKNQYAAANGITLIRIPETVDTRSIKAQLLRGIRRARPRFRPLTPSNTPNSTRPTRRMPKRREASGRPGLKRGERGEPLHDVYCRGCHARPSYKNINSYLCETCWDRWNEVRRSARVLDASDVEVFKEELAAFIKSRGRYVWHPEVYLYLRVISAADLKAHGIKVSKICRELRLFAPPDDRITGELAQRVRDYVEGHVKTHSKTPSVREVLKGAHLDHEALWSCMDYEAYIAELGGKIPTDLRHRFRDAEEFRQSAIQVVREAGHWLPMTAILKGVGVSYPAYSGKFLEVGAKEINERAGFSQKADRPEPP